jgi:hypothetical protein
MERQQPNDGSLEKDEGRGRRRLQRWWRMERQRQTLNPEP